MKIDRQLKLVAFLVAAVLAIGTLGYWIISHRQSSLVDCFYMTVITITTLGFGEVTKGSEEPAGRLFTVLVAFAGIGILTVLLSSITTMAVNSRLHERWRRRKMEKTLSTWSGHYLVCGWSQLAPGIIRELQSTSREFVLLVHKRTEVEDALDDATPEFVMEGDFTDDDMLKKAGIERAAGLFAVTPDDPVNLMLCLTARQLNPRLRIAASVYEAKNTQKMKQAGADAVVSSIAIGALRLASEMVRPSVVSFLDTMLRGNAPSLRVEEVPLPASCADRTIADLNLERFRDALLVALKNDKGWIFHPPSDRRLAAGDILIVMTTPLERQQLEQSLA